MQIPIHFASQASSTYPLPYQSSFYIDSMAYTWDEYRFQQPEETPPILRQPPSRTESGEKIPLAQVIHPPPKFTEVSIMGLILEDQKVVADTHQRKRKTAGHAANSQARPDRATHGNNGSQRASPYAYPPATNNDSTLLISVADETRKNGKIPVVDGWTHDFDPPKTETATRREDKQGSK